MLLNKVNCSLISCLKKVRSYIRIAGREEDAPVSPLFPVKPVKACINAVQQSLFKSCLQTVQSYKFTLKSTTREIVCTRGSSVSGEACQCERQCQCVTGHMTITWLGQQDVWLVTLRLAGKEDAPVAPVLPVRPVKACINAFEQSEL